MKDDLTALLSQLAQEDFCYLTTKGRISGRPHEIEIWFGAQKDSIYLMAGNHKSDWVKNLLYDPNVSVRIAVHTFTGTAHPVKEKEDELTARYMLAEKYQEWEAEKTLSEWARTALVVGIKLKSIQTDSDL